MEGSIAWHSPTTENPALDSTEEWEIWNVTGDAHPVHLHLVHFEILGREEITWDSHTTEDDRVIPNDDYATPAGDGTYLVSQPVVQHNGLLGDGFRIVNLTYGAAVPQPTGYVENAPEGHGDRPAGADHPHQGDLRQAGPLCLALPHPVARGPRDDARHVRRAGARDSEPDDNLLGTAATDSRAPRDGSPVVRSRTAARRR